MRRTIRAKWKGPVGAGAECETGIDDQSDGADAWTYSDSCPQKGAAATGAPLSTDVRDCSRNPMGAIQAPVSIPRMSGMKGYCSVQLCPICVLKQVEGSGMKLPVMRANEDPPLPRSEKTMSEAESIEIHGEKTKGKKPRKRPARITVGNQQVRATYRA